MDTNWQVGYNWFIIRNLEAEVKFPKSDCYQNISLFSSLYKSVHTLLTIKVNAIMQKKTHNPDMKRWLFLECGTFLVLFGTFLYLLVLLILFGTFWYYLPTTDLLLTYYWFTTDLLLTYYWLTTDLLMTYYPPTQYLELDTVVP